MSISEINQYYFSRILLNTNNIAGIIQHNFSNALFNNVLIKTNISGGYSFLLYCKKNNVNLNNWGEYFSFINSFNKNNYTTNLLQNLNETKRYHKTFNLFPNDCDINLHLNIVKKNTPVMKYYLRNNIWENEQVIYNNIYGYTSFFIEQIINIFTLYSNIDFDELSIYIIFPLEELSYIIDWIIQYYYTSPYIDKTNMVQSYYDPSKGTYKYIFQYIIYRNFQTYEVKRIIIEFKPINMENYIENNHIYQISTVQLYKYDKNTSTKKSISYQLDIIIKDYHKIQQFLTPNSYTNYIKIDNTYLYLLNPIHLFYNLMHLYHKYINNKSNFQISIKRRKNFLLRDFIRCYIVFFKIICNNNNNSILVTKCFKFLLKNNYIFSESSEKITNYNFLFYIFKYFKIENYISKGLNSNNQLPNILNKLNYLNEDDEYVKLKYELDKFSKNVSNKNKELNESYLMTLENINVKTNESVTNKIINKLIKDSTPNVLNTEQKQIIEEINSNQEEETFENVSTKTTKKKKPRKRNRHKKKKLLLEQTINKKNNNSQNLLIPIIINDIITNETNKEYFNNKLFLKLNTTEPYEKIYESYYSSAKSFFNNTPTTKNYIKFLLKYIVDFNKTGDFNLNIICENSTFELLQYTKNSKIQKKNINKMHQDFFNKINDIKENIYVKSFYVEAKNNLVEYIRTNKSEEVIETIKDLHKKNKDRTKIYNVPFQVELNLINSIRSIKLFDLIITNQNTNINTIYNDKINSEITKYNREEFYILKKYNSERNYKYNSILTMQIDFNSEQEILDWKVLDLFYIKIESLNKKKDKLKQKLDLTFFADDLYPIIKDSFLDSYYNDIHNILTVSQKNAGEPIRIVIFFNMLLYKTYNYFKINRIVNYSK